MLPASLGCPNGSPVAMLPPNTLRAPFRRCSIPPPATPAAWRPARSSASYRCRPFASRAGASTRSLCASASRVSACGRSSVLTAARGPRHRRCAPAARRVAGRGARRRVALALARRRAAARGRQRAGPAGLRLPQHDRALRDRGRSRRSQGEHGRSATRAHLFRPRHHPRAHLDRHPCRPCAERQGVCRSMPAHWTTRACRPS